MHAQCLNWYREYGDFFTVTATILFLACGNMESNFLKVGNKGMDCLWFMFQTKILWVQWICNCFMYMRSHGDFDWKNLCQRCWNQCLWWWCHWDKPLFLSDSEDNSDFVEGVKLGDDEKWRKFGFHWRSIKIELFLSCYFYVFFLMLLSSPKLMKDTLGSLKWIQFRNSHVLFKKIQTFENIQH